MYGLHQGVIHQGYLYDEAPFPSCHAATLVEALDGGILAAFFGGTHERNPDVCIYTVRRSCDSMTWSQPVAVADGIQARGPRMPTWNPVLFRPRGGPLMLFYKVGPSPKEWWGEVKTSDDDGVTWSPATRLPNGILGPIKNKPVQLVDGTIISPTSVEYVADPNDDANPTAPGADVPARNPAGGWDVYFEISTDGGRTWRATPRVRQPEGVKAIQPSVLVHPGNRLQAIGRTQKNQRLFEVWSDDGGRSWGAMSLTNMPNCNSGTDAVTLQDGRHLLVYNHSTTEKVRYPLNVATSADGRVWEACSVLEWEGPEQFSYPCVIQSSDGLVHVAYTWKRRRMGYAVLDPFRLRGRPVVEGRWPESLGSAE
ncbi:MAG: exo-alpha-sialidase [Tepidisphaeraceae bacterium]